MVRIRMMRIHRRLRVRMVRVRVRTLIEPGDDSCRWYRILMMRTRMVRPHRCLAEIGRAHV